MLKRGADVTSSDMIGTTMELLEEHGFTEKGISEDFLSPRRERETPERETPKVP